MSNFFSMWKTNKSSGDKNATGEMSSIANNNNNSFFDDADFGNWECARATKERMSVSHSGRFKERLRRRSSLFDGSSKMATDEEDERPTQQQKNPHGDDSSTARVHHSRSSSNSSNNSQKKAENNENINKAKVSVSYNAANQRASIDRTQIAGQSVTSHNKDLPLQSVAI